MTKFLKRILPRAAVDYLKRKRMIKSLIQSTLRDVRRFYKESSVFSTTRSESSLESLVTIDYHRLEKGLALPNPRKGFGKTAVIDLQINLLMFIEEYGMKPVVHEAVRALDEYFNFNTSFIHDEPDLYDGYLELKELAEEKNCNFDATAGTEVTTRSAVLAAVQVDYRKFFENRHSVRDFSGESVDDQIIKEAVSVAQQAPSVCNRQPWKVYCIKDDELVKKILTIQGGARGFEDSPDKLLVVAVDLNAFHYVVERNESWVDGGIFTMSLLNALHAVGLAACCLNWCVDDIRDGKLRGLLGIPEKEVLIVLIAVGHYPETFKVAASPTKALDEVLIFYR